MSERSRKLAACLVCLPFLWLHATSSQAQPKDDDAKEVAAELAKLEGTWEYEQVVRGKEIPLEKLKLSRIIIKGNSLVRKVVFEDGRELLPIKSTITIRPSRKPAEMDDVITEFNSLRPGIYELKGDKLKLCYNNDGKERPATFESKPETTFVYTVLKRKVAK